LTNVFYGEAEAPIRHDFAPTLVSCQKNRRKCAVIHHPSNARSTVEESGETFGEEISSLGIH
jgi:hypothetical protein